MKTFLLLCAFASAFAFQSCKKYADGPLVSVWPRKERIEGKWVATSVKYNSNDSLPFYKDYFWEFTRNYTVILQVGAVKKLGIWSTVSNDNDLRIDYDDGEIEQYQIRKMTRKELWLRHKNTQTDFHLSIK